MPVLTRQRVVRKTQIAVAVLAGYLAVGSVLSVLYFASIQNMPAGDLFGGKYAELLPSYLAAGFRLAVMTLPIAVVAVLIPTLFRSRAKKMRDQTNSDDQPTKGTTQP